MKRITYYDTLKFWAIFVIALTHFVGEFHEMYEMYYTKMPYSLVIGGITGKLGVAILGVIMCALAYKSSNKNALNYFFSRYIYFVITGSIINVVYILTNLYNDELTARIFLTTCFSLGDRIFPTFWCMRAFLVACLVAFIDGKYNLSEKSILIEIVLFTLAGFDWVSICLIGALVARLYSNKWINNFFSKKSTKVLVLLFIFIIIKRKESIFAFYIDGICVGLLLLVIYNSSVLKNLLGKCKVSSMLGKYTMTIFLVHNGVYMLLGEKLFLVDFINSLKYVYGFMIVFVICFCVTLIISIPMQTLLDKIMVYVKRTDLAKF